MDIMAQEPIRIRDCACPGTPHKEGDFVRLRPKLTAAGGVAAATILYTHPDSPTMRGELFEVLLIAGVGWWNLVDARKRPISINPDSITENIGWGDGAEVLFNRVQELYGEALFGKTEPEVEAGDDGPLPTSESSSSGPTDESTSATLPSSVPLRKPSKSSSPVNLAVAI